jgi:hypothetical protein
LFSYAMRLCGLLYLCFNSTAARRTAVSLNLPTFNLILWVWDMKVRSGGF